MVWVFLQSVISGEREFQIPNSFLGTKFNNLWDYDHSTFLGEGDTKKMKNFAQLSLIPSSANEDIDEEDQDKDVRSYSSFKDFLVDRMKRSKDIRYAWSWSVPNAWVCYICLPVYLESRVLDISEHQNSEVKLLLTGEYFLHTTDHHFEITKFGRSDYSWYWMECNILFSGWAVASKVCSIS